MPNRRVVDPSIVVSARRCAAVTLLRLARAGGAVSAEVGAVAVVIRVPPRVEGTEATRIRVVASIVE